MNAVTPARAFNRTGARQGAGLALVGPSNTKDTYVQLRANGTVSSLKLKNEDGAEQIVRP